MALLGCSLVAAAQAGTAALELTVIATPSGGRPEKVMRQPFYLLRASVAEIEKQARAEMPPPDLAAFVDSRDVSPELKAWMKEHKTATLSGHAFVDSLSVDDIMNVPEFNKAYITRNLIMVGLGFPRRKAKLTDREKDPVKWEESEKRFTEQVRSYVILHPESKEGMDDHLAEINPGEEWRTRQERHEQEVRQKTLQLIHARYLAGRTETDLEGVARLSGLAPGRYWLTNLWNEVRAGDVQLTWELPLELKAGQTFYLELNNANAQLPAAPR